MTVRILPPAQISGGVHRPGCASRAAVGRWGRRAETDDGRLYRFPLMLGKRAERCDGRRYRFPVLLCKCAQGCDGPLSPRPGLLYMMNFCLGFFLLVRDGLKLWWEDRKSLPPRVLPDYCLRRRGNTRRSLGRRNSEWCWAKVCVWSPELPSTLTLLRKRWWCRALLSRVEVKPLRDSAVDGTGPASLRLFRQWCEECVVVVVLVVAGWRLRLGRSLQVHNSAAPQVRDLHLEEIGRHKP